MYSIDKKDKVVILKDIPEPDGGAPCPILLQDGIKTYLIYYSPIRYDRELRESDVILVEFEGCIDTMFGGSNDEALEGHPLFSRGLTFYSIHEVIDSSWIRKREKMNSVHPYHNPNVFLKKKHYIFTFHDETFECIADGLTFKVYKGESQRKSILIELLSNLY